MTKDKVSGPSGLKLLTYQNAKTVKGETLGWKSFLLYLAPSDTSGVANVCPKASPGCKESCLFTAGRGAFSTVANARVRKTKLLFSNRVEFITQLEKDIIKASEWSYANNFKPCFRLNGTSDLPWETFNFGSIFSLFPKETFYDYTAIEKRTSLGLLNYNVTYSRKEGDTEDKLRRILSSSTNVAVVFRKELPKTYLGYEVINGDEYDLRFLDKTPCVVGLKAKGRAKKDTTGFVLFEGKDY